MKDPELLNTALEQFLGKAEKEIIETIIQTVEGHLRSILGDYCPHSSLQASPRGQDHLSYILVDYCHHM